MTLIEFIEELKTKLEDRLGDDFSVSTKDVIKNNGIVLHGMVIMNKNYNIAPTIYIDEYYSDFCKNEEMHSVEEYVSCILNKYARHEKEMNLNMDFFFDYDKVKQSVKLKLINAEKNKSLLEDVPYVKWLDLAAVFYYDFEHSQIGNATILIRNSHMDMWNVSVETIYADATDNMKKELPEEIRPIGEVLREMINQESTGQKEVFREDEGALLDNLHENIIPMYVLSNRRRIFGSSAMLYTEGIKELANNLDKNLYILPSSIHEVILVTDDGECGSSMFTDMVREVNDTQVEPEDILSYSVYYYDREKQEIAIA